jgi:TRAP-type C4-dicarboxylate transport system permease small subunit
VLQSAETTSGTAGGTFFRWLTAFNRWISRLCLMLAVTGLTAIVAVVTWQVFGRYVMNDTPIWAESLALVLVLYVTMFGAAVGVRDAGHIGMESLLAMMFPKRFEIVFELIIHFLVGAFGVLMAWHASRLAMSVMHYAIPTLGLSEGVSHVPVIIAGVLIALFSLEHILALLYGQEVVPSWH